MPTLTAVCLTCSPSLSLLTTNTTSLPSRLTIASGRSAGTGLRSSGVSARDRNEIFELMSGSTRGSRSTNFTLTSSVALLRSTVGTMRLTSPSRRSSGKASSWISAGCPTLIFAIEDSETSASTSSVSMSAIVTTAPVVPDADENGVTISPTFALFVSTMPVNGALISVWSKPTPATRRFASATAICAFSDSIVARALL